MKFYSPLRYPGGKGRLSSLIARIINANNLKDITYVEPFAGGAGLALSLLLTEKAWNVIINDIDISIYAFWHTVLNDTEWLTSKILSVDVNLEERERQKEILINHQNYPMRDLGFATFFLNRTNRSGIIRGGVIGGSSQKSNYKIDARFYRQSIAKRIEIISRYKNRIKLYNMDASKLILNLLPHLSSHSLLYFDPPYFGNRRRLYFNEFELSDHIAIAELVKKIRLPWMVSYDYCPEILNLYRSDSFFTFTLTYSANMSRPQASEVMFFGNLAVPNRVTTAKKIYIKRSGEISFDGLILT